MTAAVILPGLDGDCSLRSRFVDALGNDFRCVPISYPPSELLGYEELETLVRASLPVDESFILVAESFAGPLACRLAAAKPEGLKALFLCASFARAPLSFLRHFAAATALVPFNSVPAPLLSWSLFGRWADTEQLRLLQASLSALPLRVLRLRAREAMRADESERLGSIEVPVHVIRASHDRVITAAAQAHLVSHLPHCQVGTIEAPHAMLQAAPIECAAHIAASCRSMGSVI